MKSTSFFRFLARAAVTLPAVLASLTGVKAQETLTLYEGGTETSIYAPMFVAYFDEFSRCQTVFPARDLEDMEGGTITAVTFYTTAYNIPYTTKSQADIYLTEVAGTTITGFIDRSSATTVCSGTYNFVQDGAERGKVTITFAEPYQYNGGNLLFGCDNTTTDANYKTLYFRGKVQDGASISGYTYNQGETISAIQRDFIPMTTFTYEPAATGCTKPRKLAISGITAHTAFQIFRRKCPVYRHLEASRGTCLTKTCSD